MKSRLRPDTATMTGVITAVGVYLIYQNSLPSIADVRLAQPDDYTAEHSRKVAAWKSAALVGAVFFVARDFNSYIISGVSLVGIDLMHKHANQVNPHTGKVDVSASQSVSEIRPIPHYDSDE